MKTLKRHLLIEFILALAITGMWGCAGSGHSSENFKTRNLNSCSRMGDNQKDIDKLQSHINGLNKKMNAQNKTDISGKIEVSEDQLRDLNSANATQVQNCQPISMDDSR